MGCDWAEIGASGDELAAAVECKLPWQPMRWRHMRNWWAVFRRERNRGLFLFTRSEKGEWRRRDERFSEQHGTARVGDGLVFFDVDVALWERGKAGTGAGKAEGRDEAGGWGGRQLSRLINLKDESKALAWSQTTDHFTCSSLDFVWSLAPTC